MRPEREAIAIVGADANNLANVDVSIPRHALTAIVGVSGSGKSSLVEDTIAAVAAERMRRFLDIDQPRLHRPHVNAFVGAIPPMLFAGQHAFRASSRTTLGTSTGLLRLLRRLFVAYAEPFADDVQAPVPGASPETFGAWLAAHASGVATVWACPVAYEKTDGVRAVDRLRAAGVRDIVIRSETDRGAKAEQGTRLPIAKFKPLRPDVRHSIEAPIGEIALSRVAASKLQELLSQAWSAAPHAVFVELHGEHRPELRRAHAFGLDARAHRVHPKSPVVYARPDAHLLSFNAPSQLDSGACPTCQGLGVATGINEAALVTHPDRSMHDGAFALWTAKNYRHLNIHHVTIEGLRGRDGFDPDLPWRKLPPSARSLIFAGATEPIHGIDPKTKKRSGAPREFEGFRRAIVERVGRNTPTSEALRAFMHEGACPSCAGTRWSVQARALRIGEWSIDRLLALPLAALERKARDELFPEATPSAARSLVSNIARTAGSMTSVGLGHLSGDRGMLDVSDGESRRTRLAGVLTSRLADLLLVLDEPARGLHEQDLVSLGDALVSATELHTVVVSEHRQRIVARADHVVTLGPSAGPAGGKVTYAGAVRGTPWEHAGAPKPTRPRAGAEGRWLEMSGVDIHNVKGASVRIPLETICCIAGVSGSGKSSFVRGALVPALTRVLPKECVDAEDFRTRNGTWARIHGAEHVRALYALDQAPALATRRSLVATFLDVAESLRSAYAAQPTAKRFGLKPTDFSTNAGAGRCPRCLGIGDVDDEKCPVCGGLRFGIDALSVRLGPLSYAELLTRPVSELDRRALSPSVDPEVIDCMVELGVGHLSLGRSLDTLSGGEVQRLRIARALATHKVRGAVFVLDEPAGGLHPDDVRRLDRALRHIVEKGSTVVLVEHDPDLLASCDYIVEFGPGSGPDGGRVIAQGSPQEVRAADTPTGLALRGLPKGRSERPAKRREVAAAPTRLAAMRARAELRQILGEDVQVPEDEDSLTVPAALPPAPGQARRPLELADLDAAVLSMLLDTARSDVDEDLEKAARIWDTTRLTLLIHPLLDALSTWGSQIPLSVLAEAEKHGVAMGLEWRNSHAAAAVRAAGRRFEVGDLSAEKRRGALKDALLLGGGYVELIDSRGVVQATVCDRLMDLAAALVGPRFAAPADFRRLDPRGACPMCCGRGRVPTVSRRLLVTRERGRVADATSLEPHADAILKGVWKSEMVPFFRRLSEEGLWEEDACWDSLGPEQTATIMHGFWVRPSHGTFLKAGSKFDGSEVSHWLRWDGLVNALLGQLDRSSNAQWRDAVRASREDVPCPYCRGAGVAPHAGLLRLGSRTLDAWLRDGTLDAFLDDLERVSKRAVSARAALERTRVLDCFRPLRALGLPLGRPVEGPAAREVLARAARAFTGMDLVTE